MVDAVTYERAEHADVDVTVNVKAMPVQYPTSNQPMHLQGVTLSISHCIKCFYSSASSFQVQGLWLQSRQVARMYDVLHVVYIPELPVKQGHLIMSKFTINVNLETAVPLHRLWL